MTEAEREQLLKRWTAPPSDSEEQRAENAWRVISNAVRDSTLLSTRDIEVFLQGSYKNDTNVRLESDVDICVCLKETVTTDYSFAPGVDDKSTGVTRPARYPHDRFKNDLQTILNSAFGSANVKRGSKAFHVKENSYRVDVDVVPCLEHRRYAPDRSYITGTALFPDNGGQIYNYPHQHYLNGVEKNGRTRSFFKCSVRIMKNMRNKMEDEGIPQAKPIASFFNECLVWNTPDQILLASNWNLTVQQMLVHLWDHLQSEEKCGGWGQVSELLYLFKGPNSLSREQAKAWVKAAWNWLDYK